MSYSTSSSTTVHSASSSSSSTLFDHLPAYPKPTYNNNVEPRTSRRHALSAPAAFTTLNEKAGHRSISDNYRGAGVVYGNITSGSASPALSVVSSAKSARDDIGNVKTGHGYTDPGYRDHDSVTENANFTSVHPSPISTFTLVDKYDAFPEGSKFDDYNRCSGKQNKASSKKSSRSCGATFDFSYRNLYTTATGTASAIGSGGRAKMGSPTSSPGACQLM